jgi:hypothetical protein
MRRVEAMELPIPDDREPYAICQTLRERSWALRGLGCYACADADRLLARSEEVLARSRRLRFQIV